MRYVSVLLALALLEACAPSMVLMNEEGRFVHCTSSRCIEDRKRQGFVEVREVTRATTLVDETGRAIHCTSDSCVEDWKKNGYLEVPAVTWGVGLVNWTQAPLRVAAVEPRSPADLSGIKALDVILEVDGERVSSGRRVQEILASKKPGDRLIARIERDGVPMEIASFLRAAEKALVPAK